MYREVRNRLIHEEVVPFIQSRGYLCDTIKPPVRVRMESQTDCESQFRTRFVPARSYVFHPKNIL